MLALLSLLSRAPGNSMPAKATRKDIVSVALFRDSASSAVVAGSGALAAFEAPCYEMVAGASQVVDGTHHLVSYVEGDRSEIRLHLARDLPDEIGKAEPAFVAHLLARGEKALHGAHLLPPLETMDVLCHTGGPRVLSEVARSLGVETHRMTSSWAIMRAHGNLSGASNIAVLHHHSLRAMQQVPATLSPTSDWAVCLSMGPGVCLEGLLLRNVRSAAVHGAALVLGVGRTPSEAVAPWPTLKGWRDARRRSRGIGLASKPASLCKVAVHIVGAGLAGVTLAVSLDPARFDVRIFESAAEVTEKGYGITAWPSMVGILRDKLGVTELDFHKQSTMTIRPAGKRLDVQLPHVHPDKGFAQRSHVLDRLLARLHERHPNCIHTSHKCIRVRLNAGGDGSDGGHGASASYETNGAIVTHSCDLLVGADGVNSIVRRYVALTSDSKFFGHITAYRFLVPEPSEQLLKQTWGCFNMSVGAQFHSPCYHISSEGKALNVVLMEYDGKPAGPPRDASFAELMDVATRSELPFVLEILRTEEIAESMCYSTYHVECAPWHQPSAVVIGDAAHAYGPLTGKMANLAINDAYTLGTMLNRAEDNMGADAAAMAAVLLTKAASPKHCKHRDRCSHESSPKEMCASDLDGSSGADGVRLSSSQNRAQVLAQWEATQRPKFEITRVRTRRHLQLYTPRVRVLTKFLWCWCPGRTLAYFSSIFAYDYDFFDAEKAGGGHGVLGATADPLLAVGKLLAKVAAGGALLGMLCLRGGRLLR